MTPARYGNRNVPKMIRQVDTLRQLIRAKGVPEIQAAWDDIEPHIDYAYRAANCDRCSRALNGDRE